MFQRSAIVCFLCGCPLAEQVQCAGVGAPDNKPHWHQTCQLRFNAHGGLLHIVCFWRRLGAFDEVLRGRSVNAQAPVSILVVHLWVEVGCTSLGPWDLAYHLWVEVGCTFCPCVVLYQKLEPLHWNFNFIVIARWMSNDSLRLIVISVWL